MELKQLKTWKMRLKRIQDEVKKLEAEVSKSKLNNYLSDGVQMTSSGIQILNDKLNSMLNFHSIKDRIGITEEEGFFGLLPNETKVHVFSFLNFNDLAKLSLVCKAWKADNEPQGLIDVVWRELVVREFEQKKPSSHDGVITRLGGPSSVKVSASSVATGTPESFLSTGETFCWTQNKPFSWYSVDFGSKVKVCPTGYTFKYGSSGQECCPRNWVLQAASELNEQDEKLFEPLKNPNWTVLSQHNNDTTISEAFAVGTWRLRSNEYFRYFRLLQTGPNASKSNATVLSCLEAYGYIPFSTQYELVFRQKDTTEGEEDLYNQKPKERSWKWLYMCRKISLSKDAIKNGPGILQDNDSCYCGDWKDNNKDGYGTLVSKGSSYTGWWKNNMRHNKGIYVYDSEEGGKVRYVGEWKHDKKDGQGSMTWDIYGDKYIGHWKDDMKHGFGLFLWTEGDRLEGMWKDDMIDGHGVFTWVDGTKFEGEFKLDEICGLGVLTLSDGTSYEGNFRGSNFTYTKRVGVSILLSQLKKHALKNKHKSI